MAELDLAPIAARAQTATPGPWHFELARYDEWSKTNRGAEVDERVVTPYSGEGGGYGIDDGDAAFIAHARTDIPALVDEVRKLRAIVERVRALPTYGDHPHQFVDLLELNGALVDQCHHTDGEAECWHFGDRDGRDG